MNILVITPIYPGPGVGDNFTKVVHYFTKEWTKMGENVQVISIPSFFPKLMYYMPKWTISILQKTLSYNVPTNRIDKISRYTVENVPVIRVPLFKIHPWSKIQLGVLEQAAKIIIEQLNHINFNPDIIVGHWFDPTIYFIDYLKKYYNCKSTLVIHNHSFKYSKYVDAPDLWGCRKIDTPDVFSKLFPTKRISFRCYSGIPDSFQKATIIRKWNKIQNFIFVGTLIKRKYPDCIIKALNRSLISDYNLNIVGEGALKGKLQKLITKNKLTDKVVLLGRQNRDSIITLLDQSDIFIMISKDEVFGLVYLEAMARGCIVIASKEEGMEGIIKNGENGFLINAGDSEELTSLLNKIRAMKPEQLNSISANAMATASTLTDKKVAKEYLSLLTSLINCDYKHSRESL